MKILAIETSCDETAVCIIDAHGAFGTPFGYKVLGNALYSQVAIHAPYGGVFPNLAKREHGINLIPLLTRALEQSNLLENYRGLASAKSGQRDESDHRGPVSVNSADTVSEMLVREPELLERLRAFLEKYEKPAIDAIAVTAGPGLEPALWVGVNLARALAIIWEIPLIGVDHMEGHIMMSLMHDGALSDFSFPLVSLLISGGHTELILSKEWMQYALIGQTRDDAVGEAFDKVARLLDLPYPGGPQISKLAAQARLRPQGEALGITFTSPMLHSKDFDFSFSGLKTEVRKYVEGAAPLDDDMKMQIALAFEDAVAHVLVSKTLKAVDEFGAETIVVGGGVSANAFIRECLAGALAKAGNVQLLVPPPDLATDNALMIALAGYFHALKDDYADPATLRANGNLRLAPKI